MTEERRASSDGRADDVVLEGTRRRGVEGSRGLAIVDMAAVGLVMDWGDVYGGGGD